MNYGDAKRLARELRKNQTKTEAYFWQRVRNRKFYGLKFTRQFPIEYSLHGHNKNFFIVDFYCHEHLLIVVLDGEIHRYQKEYDQEREDILIARGYKIVRFANEDVLNNWNKVREELKRIAGIKD